MTFYSTEEHKAFAHVQAMQASKKEALVLVQRWLAQAGYSADVEAWDIAEFDTCAVTVRAHISGEDSALLVHWRIYAAVAIAYVELTSRAGLVTRHRTPQLGSVVEALVALRQSGMLPKRYLATS